MKKYILIAAMAVTPLLAAAWGQKGHDVVAYIAQQHLTPAAADSVADLFNGRSMVYWANWLDNASHRPDYAYTKTWHYKNIEGGVPYAEARLEPKGDVVTAVREQIAILSDSVSTRGQKELALKIIVHCVGDMHQPMHMGHLSDRGGNNHKVKFFDHDSNLHSIWDGSLLSSAHSWTYTEWQDQIDRLTPEQEAVETAGNVDDWAEQTYSITSRVYDFFPEGTKVSYNQIADWSYTIELQLLRGGLRLARILNTIFDPEVTSDQEF